MKLSTTLLAAFAHSTIAESCSLECPEGKVCDTDEFNNQYCRRAKTCDILQCGENEECSPRQKACVCQDGFDRHENGQCVLDPCHSDNSVCSRFATCEKYSQADGTFSSACDCREGTVGNGFECVSDKCYNGSNRCGANSKCEMINFDHGWDYECFCKKNHVSYAARQPESRGVAQMGFTNKVGGYRETCEPFRCTPETKNVQDGFQTDSKDARYKVFIPSNTTSPMAWEAAKQECMEFGNLWDLAVIESKEEMDRVLSLTKCQHNAFWVGAKKPWVGSGFKNVFSDPMGYSPWQEGFPTDKEQDTCVRMHLGKINNANCRSSTSKKRTNNLGMGFICEKHTRQPANGIKCEAKENQRIKALTVPAGCPKPSCLGKNKFKVIDAWKRKSNNALYQWDYGFSALIELPNDAYDLNGGSILLRFAQGNRQGSIQTWNFRYFGFYNNNNDVLFHTKYWRDGDREGPQSALITVDGINTPDFPDVFYWDKRVTAHHCFQNQLSRSGPSFTDFFPLAQQLNDRVDQEDDVVSVKFKNGQIRQVKTN